MRSKFNANWRTLLTNLGLDGEGGRATPPIIGQCRSSDALRSIQSVFDQFHHSTSICGDREDHPASPSPNRLRSVPEENRRPSDSSWSARTSICLYQWDTAISLQDSGDFRSTMAARRPTLVTIAVNERWATVGHNFQAQGHIGPSAHPTLQSIKIQALLDENTAGTPSFS